MADVDRSFIWTNTCRLCLSKHNIRLDVFEDDNILSKIRENLNMVIYRGDPMPRKMCNSCWELLDSWIIFRENCRAVNEKLNEALKEHVACSNVATYMKKVAESETGPNENLSKRLNDDKICSDVVTELLKISRIVNDEASDSPKSPVVDPVNNENAHDGDSNRDLSEEFCEDTDYDDSPPPPHVEHPEVEELNELPMTPDPLATDESLQPSVSTSALEADLSVTSTTSNTYCPIIKNEEDTDMIDDDSDISNHSNTQLESTPTSSGFNLANVKREIPDDEDWPQPAMITSVEGCATAIWHSVKVEGDMSEEGSAERDRSYNLRPRRDLIPYNMEAIENWIENEQFTPIVPSKQKMTPWQCQPCKLYFSSKDILSKHLLSPQCQGHLTETFACPVCSRIYFTLEDLAWHQVMHLRVAHHLTIDELLSCRICHLRFSDSHRLREHFSQHKTQPGIKHVCSTCGQVFLNKAIYDKHVRLQLCSVLTNPATPIAPTYSTIANEFNCSICQKRFDQEDLLYDHRFAFHGVPDERVPCKICDMKFRNVDSLADHEKSHKQNPTARKTTLQSAPGLIANANQCARQGDLLAKGNVRCRRCGKLFTSADELLKHEASQHKNLSPHFCRKCSRRFATRSLLLLHHRSHAGRSKMNVGVPTTHEEIPPESLDDNQDLTCTVCKIKFEDLSDINQHRNRHKVFAGVCKLKSRTSSGKLVYKYMCSDCPQLFCNTHSLPKHRRVTHQGRHITFSQLAKSICRNGVLPDEKSTAEKVTVEVVIKQEIIDDDVIHLETNQESAGPPTTSSVKCPHCVNSFAPSYIAKHLRAAHKVFSSGAPSSGLLKCRFCAKVCTTRYNLKRHESCHDPTKPNAYLCGKCGVRCPTFKTYITHRKVCKVGKDVNKSSAGSPSKSESSPSRAGGGRTCPICMKSYETVNSFQLHVMTTHGLTALQNLESEASSLEHATPPQKRNSCDIELWREETNKIVRTINGIHRCTVCKINFQSYQLAVWHRNQHPRGNSYIVQIDDSLYQCTVCNSFLNSRYVALEHALNHADPIPQQKRPHSYKCPFCSSIFNSEEFVRNHIKYVHPEGVNIIM